MTHPTEDFIAADQGTIVLLRPRTDHAKDWVREYLPEDAMWFGRSVAIERRYFADIYHGILAAGLTVA